MSEYVPKSPPVSVLISQVVCPATYRRVVFDPTVDAVRKEIGVESAQRYAIVLLDSGTDHDQVHLLLQSVPTYSPTQMVQTMQSLTAREIFRRVPAVKKQGWGGECWSKGSLISPVGRHGRAEVIRQYVKTQGTDKASTTLHSQPLQLDLL